MLKTKIDWMEHQITAVDGKTQEPAGICSFVMKDGCMVIDYLMSYTGWQGCEKQLLTAAKKTARANHCQLVVARHVMAVDTTSAYIKKANIPCM